MNRAERIWGLMRGLEPSVAAPMADQQQRAHMDEERHYYVLNAKVWRVLAPFYDTIVFPLKRLRRDVASLAGVGPGSRVLDVATGTGAQALAFAETGAEGVGVDLSESMLRIARRKARGRNVTFRIADARELPFEDARFDVCCVSFGLHEMPVTVRQQALLEMARVTKPNGNVVIVDYALPDDPIASKVVYHLVKLYEGDHYAEFVRSDLHAMLERAGLAAGTEARVAPGPAMLWWSPAIVVIAAKIGASNSAVGDKGEPRPIRASAEPPMV